MLGGNDTIIALLRDVVLELRELNKLLREAVCQSRGFSRDELMAALPAIEDRVKAALRRARGHST